MTDNQSALIVDANVTTANTATGERRSTATDSSGAFAIAFLPPAEYRLSITAQGFATATYNHVTVAGNATATLNVKLDVAAANVHVEVNDAPPLLQTSSAELATALSVETLTSMPLRPTITGDIGDLATAEWTANEWM